MLFGKDAQRLFMLGVQYLKIETASGVTNFNGGYQGMLKVFKELGINPGEYCIDFCEKNNYRIQQTERNAILASKQRRKQLRAKRKDFADADKEREGVK